MRHKLLIGKNIMEIKRKVRKDFIRHNNCRIEGYWNVLMDRVVRKVKSDIYGKYCEMIYGIDDEEYLDGCYEVGEAKDLYKRLQYVYEYIDVIKPNYAVIEQRSIMIENYKEKKDYNEEARNKIRESKIDLLPYKYHYVYDLAEILGEDGERCRRDKHKLSTKYNDNDCLDNSNDDRLLVKEDNTSITSIENLALLISHEYKVMKNKLKTDQSKVEYKSPISNKYYRVSHNKIIPLNQDESKTKENDNEKVHQLKFPNKKIKAGRISNFCSTKSFFSKMKKKDAINTGLQITLYNCFIKCSNIISKANYNQRNTATNRLPSIASSSNKHSNNHHRKILSNVSSQPKLLIPFSYNSNSSSKGNFINNQTHQSYSNHKSIKSNLQKSLYALHKKTKSILI